MPAGFSWGASRLDRFPQEPPLPPAHQSPSLHIQPLPLSSLILFHSGPSHPPMALMTPSFQPRPPC